MTRISSANDLANQQEDLESLSSPKSSGSKKWSKLQTAVMAGMILLSASSVFSQKQSVSDKDLKEQYTLVMKDLKKNDAAIKKAATTYEVKAKKVLSTVEPEVEYVIKTLIPTIYEDHLSIKKHLKTGLNKEELLKLVYLLKGDVVWGFSQELGKRVWSFETTNKYSDQAKYPVYVIDNSIEHYAKSPSAKTQLKLIEETFQEALEGIDAQFQQGKVTITFPLVAMYNKQFSEWEKIKDTPKWKNTSTRSMIKYIVWQPAKNADGSIDVTFDINKFIDDEMAAGNMTDKSTITIRLFQEMMRIAAIKAFVEQYGLYIDEWSEDIQQN